MNNLMAEIILGHLVGDYLLQNRTMALKKSEKGFGGSLWCALHCALYTTAVALFIWQAKPLILFLIFLSHWPIDRWSLASTWLKIIKGRDIFAAYASKEKYREIDLIFSCIVYTVADNTLHLSLLWVITKFI